MSCRSHWLFKVWWHRYGDQAMYSFNIIITLASTLLCSSVLRFSWVLGDLNYPKLDWDKDDVPYIKAGCAHTKLYDSFIETMSDFNFSQMVREPTRQNQQESFLVGLFQLIPERQ